jgi:methylenetetrahydrofolate dehydrogenase (NADP+)/methenyltetrahydrofolate cyclohydrolase
MRIDGRAIAGEIFDDLTKRVGELQREGINPHLAVILVGENPSSKTYVHQKELKAGQIGAEISVFRYPASITEQQLLEKIKRLNDDSSIHGIIIQRPLPSHIDEQKVTDATDPTKDVDGFSTLSPFTPPVALAVWRILEEAHLIVGSSEPFSSWLQTKQSVILGKGKTAGMPIIQYFQQNNIPLTIIGSKTPDKDSQIKNADIIISAVGKEDLLKPEAIKNGAIVIGVGMFANEEGKLQGDYDQRQISEKTAAYTTIPGGVGPVNVAMLLANLIDASKRKSY